MAIDLQKGGDQHKIDLTKGTTNETLSKVCANCVHPRGKLGVSAACADFVSRHRVGSGRHFLCSAVDAHSTLLPQPRLYQVAD